jgi:hypothetical protein
VTTRLDDLDRSGMQDIIRTLARRIEIGDGHIEVIFRVSPPDGPSGPSPIDASGSWQHCTGVGRGAFVQLAMIRLMMRRNRKARSAFESYNRLSVG